jgi:hypothetical protein
VRSGCFSFREPLFLFPRMTLHRDRLELAGWSWRGRYRRQIAVARILQVDVTSTGRLLLWLSSGETLRLRVRNADAWKQAIDACRPTSR